MSKQHWEDVYASKSADAVSWFEPQASTSLELIDALGLPRSAPIIDVGGGASTLVDDLLARGFSDLTVLDLSHAALRTSKSRLADRANAVAWIDVDVLEAPLGSDHFALWHDRAVFHFLTEAAQRAAYVTQAARCVRPGGHLIIATFAEDGPERCSGLPVARYRAEALAQQFEAAFDPVSSRPVEHRTPWGSVQRFTYCVLRRKA